MDGVQHGKFAISLDGMGSFSERFPRVVFVNLSDGAADAARIARYLKDEAGRIGVRTEDREFSAHLTIGRAKHTMDADRILEFIKSAADVEFGSFECDRIALLESKITEAGPEYTELHSKILG